MYLLIFSDDIWNFGLQLLGFLSRLSTIFHLIFTSHTYETNLLIIKSFSGIFPIS